MGIKQLYNDNLRKLPNEYGDVSVMVENLLQMIFSALSTTWKFKTLHGYEFGRTERLLSYRFI